jgi:HSP20 family protein
MRREDVELRITGSILELAGGSRPLPEGHQFLRMERSHGRFHRTLDLGGPVDRENIEAHLRDGILTVTLPKLPPTAPEATEGREGSGGPARRRPGDPRDGEA